MLARPRAGQRTGPHPNRRTGAANRTKDVTRAGAAFGLLLDDDDVSDDADDLGDEVLEDDEDEEVSFEDLGDVAGDDE